MPESSNPNLSYVIAPETQKTSGGTPPSLENPLKPETKSKRGLAIGITAGSLALAAALAGGFGFAANNSGEKPPQATESSAPADTNVDSEDGGETEQPPVSVESIPTGLSSAELGEYIVENIYDEWSHAGANEETVNEYLSLNVTREEFAATVAARNTPVYATAMFGDDYKSNPELNAIVSGFETENAGFIAGYLSTVYNEAAAATYVTSHNVDPASVVELFNDNVTRTIDIPYTFESNAGSLEGIVDETSIPSGVITVSTIEKDGKTIVTAFDTRQ